MNNIEWEEENVGEELRKLSKEEIEEIVMSLKFNNNHNIVQENIINIHREKTRRKLKTIKIKSNKIIELKKLIIKHFYNSLVAPGEAVGINAAQCIGEPTTQSTLNSVERSEKILIQRNDGKTKIVSIGDWIDKKLEKNKERIVKIKENRTEYLELEKKYWTPSPDKRGKVKWSEIKGITKHLPVDNLVKIITKLGREVTVTKSKSLLIWDGKELIQKGGGDVKIGDLVPIIYKLEKPKIELKEIKIENKKIKMDKMLGKIVGRILNKGIIKENKVIIDKKEIEEWCKENEIKNKIKEDKIEIKSEELMKWIGNKIPDEAYTSNIEFVVGIIEELREYKNINILYSRIGNEITDKRNDLIKISKIEENRIREDILLDEIVDIIEIKINKEIEYVYDLTVPDTTNFSLSNGLGIADTFHSAGLSVKNVTLGFPRAREIFNATKTPSSPMCIIYFNRDNESPEELHKICDKFPETIINNIIKEYKIYEPSDYQLEYWHILWFKMYPEFGELSEEDWCIRLYFDISKLYELDLTVKEIAKNLKNLYGDIRCIPSPLNKGIVDIIVNCSEINVNNGKIEEIEDDYSAKKYYMERIVSSKIRSIMISGIKGITKLYKRKAKNNESFGEYRLKPEIKNRIKNDEEWIIETDGTNLIEVLGKEGVDTERTISNDMWEIMNIFGIEAARVYIYLEFLNIVNSGGNSINPVHINILVDKMTYTGSIRAIARFGVETAQYNPIARATFEEVMNQILTSAMFSENDNLNGISSNIVLGTKINAGTGRVEFEDIPMRIIKKPKEEKEKIGIGIKIKPPSQLKTLLKE